MIHFKDKETDIFLGNVDTKMKFSDLIKICLGNAQGGGLTISQMRERLKLMDKFDNPKKGSIELETIELDLIKSILLSFPWNFVHKDVVSLEDYINSLK